MFHETCFAKVVSDTDGWDHILIEGTLISLSIEDRDKNNTIVDALVRGLRSQALFSGECAAQLVESAGQAEAA